MALVKVVRGEYVYADQFFRDVKGLPVEGTGPATFMVQDYYNNPVATGTALQDTLDPSLWSAQFAIPLTAPVSLKGDRYQINWELPTADGITRAIERFEVMMDGDPIKPVHDTNIVCMERGQLVDQLIVNGEIETGSLKYTVVDIDGDVIYEAGALPSTLIGRWIDSDTQQFTFKSPGPIEEMVVSNGQYGFQPYLGRWTWQFNGSGIDAIEIHPIYVVSYQAANLADKLRKLIDRAKLGDIHPYLRYTEADLIHYLIRGLEVYNASPPQLTTVGLANVPPQAVDLVVKAAAVEALRAQFLAEGMSAFDFQGLGVQLNVDRTMFLQTMADTLAAEVDQKLAAVKKLIARSGMPVLGISIGSYTNGMWGTFGGNRMGPGKNQNPLDNGVVGFPYGPIR